MAQRKILKLENIKKNRPYQNLCYVVKAIINGKCIALNV